MFSQTARLRQMEAARSRCIVESDLLFDKLNQKLVMIIEKDYMSIASRAVQEMRKENPDKPDWLESLLISFSLEVRDEIFYPEKEV